jgi:hypothetical protein
MAAARRRLQAAATATLLALGLATGCSGHDSGNRTGSGPREHAGASPTAVMAHPAAARLDLQAPDAAVQLRSALEMSLGDHVLLTVELMRDRLGRGPSGRAQAAIDAVTANTDTLSSAIEGLFGATAAATFTELWSAHVKDLADYASALAAHDDAVVRQAEADLRQTEADLGAFLSDATGHRLGAAAARAAVTMHVQMLLDQASRYAAGDYAASYRLETRGLEHMITVADTLAMAIARTKGLATRDLSSPRRQLQSALARLFAEHMGVVVEAMRADVDRAADFGPVGDTLNLNTSALGAAIGALYGQAAARAFTQLWAQHVDALIAYADATARHDDAGKQAAQRSLDDFATKMAEFLATATDQRLPAVQLSGALTEHDQHLTTQLDAYATGDFSRAQQIAATGYAHMFTLADALATAIGNSVAARLPRGGAQTGGGGTARRR